MHYIGGIFNYWAALIFILLGFFALISAKNLIRKIVGLTIIQNAVILFFISIAFKHHGSIPIIPHHLLHSTINADHFVNPLPHALMLTAIVVGVSTLGVALALMLALYRKYRSIEEDEILAKINAENESIPGGVES